MTTTVTLVSMNIWDLPVPLLRDDRKVRRRHLLEQLPALSADLVLIQEAFVPDFRSQLARVMTGYHVDHFVASDRRVGPLRIDGSGGLLTFSRWPIRWCTYRPSRRVRGMKPDERIGRKGCLWAELETPAGPLLVGNVHLYAGADLVSARIRAMQTRQLLRELDRSGTGPAILAGDFNMVAGAEPTGGRPSAFDRLHRAGLAAPGGEPDRPHTMRPSANRYARFLHWDRSDRKLTHVFYRGPGLTPGAEAPTVCLHDPPVSDHFGLKVTLEMAGSSGEPGAQRGAAGTGRKT